MKNLFLLAVLFLPSCILDNVSDDGLFAACAIIGACLLAYAFDCFARRADYDELEL